MRYTKQCSLLVLVAGLAASSAWAQPATSLSGTYRCVQGCASGYERGQATITQNGWNMNVVTESGLASRAWFDWISPTNRIWINSLNQGAVYSPTGMTIQFDQGAVWDRVQNPEIVAAAACARRFRSYDPYTQTYRVRSGLRRPCPVG